MHSIDICVSAAAHVRALKRSTRRAFQQIGAIPTATDRPGPTHRHQDQGVLTISLALAMLGALACAECTGTTCSPPLVLRPASAALTTARSFNRRTPPRTRRPADAVPCARWGHSPQPRDAHRGSSPATRYRRPQRRRAGRTPGPGWSCTCDRRTDQPFISPTRNRPRDTRRRAASQKRCDSIIAVRVALRTSPLLALLVAMLAFT